MAQFGHKVQLCAKKKRNKISLLFLFRKSSNTRSIEAFSSFRMCSQPFHQKALNEAVNLWYRGGLENMDHDVFHEGSYEDALMCRT